MKINKVLTLHIIIIILTLILYINQVTIKDYHCDHVYTFIVQMGTSIRICM